MSVPGPPNIYVRPRALLNSIILYWRPPVTIGSSEITGYTIVNDEISYSQDVGPGARAHTITGLSVGNDYTFTILARNSSGPGPSATYRTVQVGLRPSQPGSINVAVATSTSANVSWSFSAGENQARTRWFLVKAIPSSIYDAPTVVKSAHGRERGRTINNLSTGLSYSFLVQGVNDVAYSFPTPGSTSAYVNIGPQPENNFDPETLPGLVFYANMSSLSPGPLTSIANQLNPADISLSISLSGTGTIVANGLNSLNVLSMTTSDQLTGPALNLPNYTIFTVAQRTSSSGYIFTDGSTNAYGYIGEEIVTFNIGDGSISYSSNNQWSTPTWDIQSFSKYNDVNGVNLLFKWNGITVLNRNSATYTNTDALLANFSINTTEPSSNNIAAIYIFNTTLSPQDIEIMEGYLANVWNLQANLPEGHPYKLANPAKNVNLYFSPTQVPGCQLWLDAQDSATLIGSNNQITQWLDKSSYSRDASGSATYQNNGLVFDGSTSNFTTTYIPASSNYKETAFIVVNFNSTATQDLISGTQTGDRRYFYNQSSLGLGRLSGTALSNGGNPTQNTTSILTYTTDSSNTKFYLNALLKGTSTTSLNFNNNGYTTIGFNGKDTNNYFQGAVYEVILYNRALTNDDRKLIEGYLTWKWGLQSIIPQSHPYTYLAPTDAITADFNPTSIKNCQFWVSADDPQNNGLKPSNNTQVNTWYDKSGYAHNLITIAGRPRPTYSQSNINGLPALNFTNSSGLYTSPFPKSTNATLLWVGSLATTESQSGTLWGHFASGSQSADIQLRRLSNSSTVSWHTNSDDISGNLVNSVNLPTLYSCTMSNGIKLFAQQTNPNGTISLDYTELTKSWTSGNAPIWVGISDTDQPFIGHISEILYYQRVLTPIERQVAEGYLAWKYGLASSLPANHPYQNTKPRFDTPTSWSPTSIKNLRTWLDGLGISGNLATGAPVSLWLDRGIFQKNALQTVAENRPIVEVGGGVNFDGVNSFMVFAEGDSPVLTQSVTCFFVTSKTLSTASYLYATNNNTSEILLNYNNSDVYTFNVASNDNAIIGTTNEPVLLYNFTREDATYMNAYYMGYQVIFTSAPTTNNSVVEITMLGGSLNSSTLMNGFEGTIYEMIIYTEALTDTQRQVVEGYLAWKWNIQLASNHPFALRPPSSNEPLYWSPANLDGLNLWIDLKDKASIVKANIDTGPLQQSDIHKLLQVLDKSGEENHMKQKTGIINFLTGDVFDMPAERTRIEFENTYFTGSFNTPITTPYYSAFSVGDSRNSDAVYGRLLSLGQLNTNDDDNASSSVAISRGDGQNIITKRNNIETLLSLPIQAEQLLIYSSQQPAIGYLGLNGNTPVSNSTAVSSAFNFTTYAVGSNVNTGNNLLTGSISEIILTDTILKTGQRQLVEGYMAWKWDIEAYLPKEHAYSKAAPLFDQVVEWLPTNIGQPQLWLDASTLDYTNGQTISSWPDKSNNSTISTTPSKNNPTLTINALNNQSVATFTTGQSLSVLLEYNINRSFFAVSRQTGSSNQRIFGSTNSNVAIGYDNGKKQVLNVNGQPNVTSTVNSDTNWDIISMTLSEMSNDLFTFSSQINTNKTLAYNGSYWLCSGIDANQNLIIAKSVNGYAWTPSTNNPFVINNVAGDITQIAWSSTQNLWTAVGGSSGNSVHIATSSNGLTWTASAFTFPSTPVCVASRGPLWLAGSANIVYYSSDTVTWTAASTLPEDIISITSISWNATQSLWAFIGMVANGSIIATSPDGDIWTERYTIPQQFTTITNNGSLWLATGDVGAVYRSTNAITWTTNYIATLQSLLSLAWNGSIWVAVGIKSDGTQTYVFYISSDGITWLNGPTPYFLNMTLANNAKLVWGQNQFILVTVNGHLNTRLLSNPNNTFFSSLDGINWICPPLQGTRNLYTFAQNGTQLSSGTDVSPILNLQLNGSNQTNYSDCQIAEVLVYNSALTLDERRAVEGYLAWKWGVQANLPINHPYFAKPPTTYQQVGWSPSNLTNSGLWLDGSDPYNNLISIATNANINIWFDKLPLPQQTTIRNGNLTVNNNILNGHSVITYDGTSDLSVIYPNLTPIFTIFIVHYLDTSGSDFRMLASDTTSTIQMFTDDIGQVYFNQPTLKTPNSNPSNNYNWLISCVNSNSIYKEIHVNGVLSSYSTEYSPAFTNTMSNLVIGGIDTNVDESWLGSIAEVIYYEWSLTDSQRVVVEGYLATKYGLQGSLVSSHPFKEIVPAIDEPTELLFTGLQLWLDGADTSTITFNGTTVTQWNDKSGKNNNTTGIVGTPTYNTGLVFDGSSYFTLPDGCIPANNSAYTIYVVASLTDTSQTNGIFSAGVNTPYNIIRIENSTTNIVTDLSGSIMVSSNAITQNSPFVYLTGYDSDKRTMSQFTSLNGVYTSQNNYIIRGQPSGPNYLGSSPGGNMIGTVSEFLVYNYVHSQAQRQIIEGYLKHKWNAPDFTSTHPYYSYKPALITGPPNPNKYSIAVGVSQDYHGISYSADGLNWFDSLNNPFVKGEARGIAYGNGLWVCVGKNISSTICIIISLDDGKTWIPSLNNPFANGTAYDVAYNGEYFVAVGTSPGLTCIASSFDGLTWAPSTNNPYTQCFCIAWANTYWLAGGASTSGAVAKSYDGLTWTNSNSPLFTECFGLAWSTSQAKWIAVGAPMEGYNSIAYSTNDGESWTASTANPFSVAKGIAWSEQQSKWVAVGTSSDSFSIATSPDGLTWTSNTGTVPFFGSAGLSVTWNGNLWIASGQACALAWDTQNQIWSTNSYGYPVRSSNLILSTNGQNWVPATNSTLPATVYRIAGKANSPPSYIGNLTVSNITTSAFTVSWSGGFGTETYSFTLNGTTTTPLSQTANSARFTGLTTATTYTIVITGTNAYGSTSSDFLLSSYATVSLWYDGADPLGTGVVPSDGTSIGTWYDKSTFEKDAIATNGNPTYVSSYNSIVFNNNGYIMPNNSLPYNNSAYSIFTVTTIRNLDYESGYILNSGTGEPDTGFVLAVDTTGAVFTNWSDSTNTVSATNITLNQPFLVCTTYNNSINSRTLFLNGTLSATTETSTRNGSGLENYIAAKTDGSGNPTLFASNVISEILVYEISLQPDARRKIEGYLAWKWGLQSQLPPEHPFAKLRIAENLQVTTA